jgi:hypothetical protein
MHIVIRTYYGRNTRKLFEAAEQHEAELQTLMRTVDGLVSYTLARDGRGGFSVTISRNKCGINQSLKHAKAFLAKHAPQNKLAAMQISEGRVITHLPA